MNVNVNNPPKLLGILLGMVLLTVVFAIGTLSESGYLGLMGLIVGYLVGDGVAAYAGHTTESVLGETDEAEAERLE